MAGCPPPPCPRGSVPKERKIVPHQNVAELSFPSPPFGPLVMERPACHFEPSRAGYGAYHRSFINKYSGLIVSLSSRYNTVNPTCSIRLVLLLLLTPFHVALIVVEG